MESKLAAGATIDTLTHKELDTVLRTVQRDWFQQVARGDRYRRFYASETISGGAISIGGADSRDDNLGPSDGFVWAVKRIAVSGLTTNTGTPLTSSTEPVALFINDESASTCVHPNLQGFAAFDQDTLVLYPGDRLFITATGLTKTGIVTISGQARELPMPLAYRLGGG
jgi:hypothetical protein